MGLLKLGKCPICDWPLAATTAEGCTIDNCSYRPDEGSPEHHRIRQRRLFLAQLKDRVKADNNLMDELEQLLEVPDGTAVQ